MIYFQVPVTAVVTLAAPTMFNAIRITVVTSNVTRNAGRTRVEVLAGNRVIIAYSRKRKKIQSEQT